MAKIDVQHIIQEALQGKQIAYKILLNTYWQDVYLFQLSKTNNVDEAEDITIKSFAKSFDKLHTFDTNYTFKTWLLTISKNIYIDHLRKEKKQTISIDKNDRVFNIKDETPSIEDKIITEQNLAKLLANIKKMKPQYQEIIHLRFFQEMSYKEIALELNEPMNNVKVKLLRAKKILAEIIRKKAL